MEEATAEFEKVFKSKTGNVWSADMQFEKKPKKYRLVEVHQSAHKRKPTEFLKPFDWKAAQPSRLSPEIQKAIRIITDVSMLTRALADNNIDTEEMPLGRISKRDLNDAYQILVKLKEAIEKAESLRAQTSQLTEVVSLDSIQDQYDSIAELSNQFYEILPQANFRAEAIEPISTIGMVLLFSIIYPS